MQRNEITLLVLLFLLTFILSVWSPTGKIVEFPKYWWDEAFTFEQARTFMELGRVDFTVAPGTPSQKAITLSASGPPVSIPLAGVFSLFNTGILQARIYMLLWLMLTTGFLFFFLKRIFDTSSAFAGTLLVVTLASFYANGRTATGDIPAFFFLLAALYILLEKKMFFWSGIFFALAAVTKTSVFHMALPAAGILLLIMEKRNFLKPALAMGSGMGLVLLGWFMLLLPYPYSLSDITPAIEFYKNPTHKTSVIDQFTGGIPSVLLSSTMLYFGVLFASIVCRFKNTMFSQRQQAVFMFYILYSILQAIVFLRSPGWIRYLIGWQLLTLSLFYPILQTYLTRYGSVLLFLPFTPKKIALFAVAVLAALQTGHYFFFSDILPRQDITPRAKLVNALLEQNPGSTIGFVNNPMMAALVPGNRKYQTVLVGGNTYAGIHPLDLPQNQWPTFFETSDKTHDTLLDTHYEKFLLPDGSLLYRRR